MAGLLETPCCCVGNNPAFALETKPKISLSEFLFERCAHVEKTKTPKKCLLCSKVRERGHLPISSSAQRHGKKFATFWNRKWGWGFRRPHPTRRRRPEPPHHLDFRAVGWGERSGWPGARHNTKHSGCRGACGRDGRSRWLPTGHHWGC